MDRDDFRALAEQAERLSKEAPTRGIAGSWTLIAKGFRRLAALQASTRQYWREARSQEPVGKGDNQN